MFFVIEFTKHQGTVKLSEMLMGICVNTNKVNNDVKHILINDLKKYKPTRLYHTYDRRELIGLLEWVKGQKDANLVCKEIIPTVYNVGLVREVDFSLDNIPSLATMLYGRYRYYLVCTYESNGREISCVITYNENVKELVNKQIKLSEVLTVNASTLQLGDIRNLQRVLDIERTIPNDEGEYVVYTIQN